MKYDLKKFNKAVDYYQKKLQQYKGKTIYIRIPLADERAYYATAPLTRAIHNLNSMVHISVAEENSGAIKAVNAIWSANEDIKNRVNNPSAKALDLFIKEVDKKAKGKFRKIFVKPDLVLVSNGNSFCSDDVNLKIMPNWFRRYRWKELLQTAKIIWKQVYNLKKSEKLGFGFETIPIKKKMELPLEDYLDSYAINRAMAVSVKNKKSASASTSVWSQLSEGERVGELKSTLLGCELDKDINEPVFKKYKKVSELLIRNRIKPNDAVFGIHGKGYHGKHLFGEIIGYPTKNRKSRWSSPSGIVYQFDWLPQTKEDSRSPMTRVAFTETLPIDLFIKTCKIDWLSMQKKNNKIVDIFDKSEKIIVNSAKKNGTNFEVGLIKRNGENRLTRGSDVDTRSKINKDYYKVTGIKAGTMANLPGGEAFTTPEYVSGRVVGDVVISIDQSYRLSKKQPFVINATKHGYTVESASPKVKKKFNKMKKDAWKRLLIMEKSKALPKKIIQLKKKNFNNIGEFAVNTSPTAELCDYLIVNEKIAGMIHVAMGSGFDADKSTEYHTDVVIDAEKQKLDIYGVKKGSGMELWILKKGKFVF
jgi:hypothetical protein